VQQHDQPHRLGRFVCLCARARFGICTFVLEEIIYGGGGPQAAMTWWMNDQIHRDAILKARSTEMGVGYAYFANGSYGDYIVVVFGSQ
jgi:uncharacterized protein YkwD